MIALKNRKAPPATGAGAGERSRPGLPPFLLEFKKYWTYKYLTLLLLPGILWYIVFKYVPIYGLTLAFKDFTFRKGILGSAWVGLEHFRYLFSLPGFWTVFRNSVVINVYQLLVGFPAPILFALLLNEITSLRIKKTVQTISYLPHFLSWVILASMFTQLLSPSTGPINLLLSSLGIEPIYFLASPRWFRGVLVVTNVWKSVGWSSIIYLAALANVDVEMYEAARMDGANKLQEMLHITLPSIAGVITVMLIFQAGKLLNDNFDQVFNLYNAAVYEVGDVLGTYTYRMGLKDMQYSLSTAVGLVTNVISFGLVVLTNAVAKRINDYGIW